MVVSAVNRRALSGRVERRKAALQSFRQHDRRKAGDHRSDWFRGDPFWDVSNIGAFPTVSHLVVGTFPTLPFAIFSIMFVGILNPMNIAYKNVKKIRTWQNIKFTRTQSGLFSSCRYRAVVCHVHRTFYQRSRCATSLSG